MTDHFEFELVFEIPEDKHDSSDLANAVFETGLFDPLVGTGAPGILAVVLQAEDDDAKTAILNAAQALRKTLPEDTKLLEIRPDDVGLNEIAELLNVEVPTSASGQHEMPFRIIDDLAAALDEVIKREPDKQQQFDVAHAKNWIHSSRIAREMNIALSENRLDPFTFEYVSTGKSKNPK